MAQFAVPTPDWIKPPDGSRMIRFNASSGQFGRLELERPPVTSPIARPYAHLLGVESHPTDIRPRAAGFTPPALAKHYSFPTNVDGTGQRIGLIELGGGYDETALAPYWTSIGVKRPKIQSYGWNGAINRPGDAADGEVCLDICVAAGLAPGAEIAVIFAPNDDRSFIGSCRYAFDVVKVTALSISWGGPEAQWPKQSISDFEACLAYGKSKGIPTFVASGDAGSSDGLPGLNVDCPACLPSAIGCGGTYVGAGGEVAWSDGGGGYSNVFIRPAYQAALSKDARRLVPDVAGNADPASGWDVSVNGRRQYVGGTSAVAPMWAALAALVQQATGKPLTHELLYANAGTFFDVVKGGN